MCGLSQQHSICGLSRQHVLFCVYFKLPDLLARHKLVSSSFKPLVIILNSKSTHKSWKWGTQVMPYNSMKQVCFLHVPYWTEIELVLTSSYSTIGWFTFTINTNLMVILNRPIYTKQWTCFSVSHQRYFWPCNPCSYDVLWDLWPYSYYVCLMP